MTCLGSLCELPSHCIILPLNAAKVPGDVNFRRESILFLYLKNYQVFFKEALKIFEKTKMHASAF